MSTQWCLILVTPDDATYKNRLVKPKLLALSHWHEYLVLDYIFKALFISCDPYISVKSTGRVTRCTS